MTTIVFYRTEEGILGFKAQDHAGYAPEGSDIVCAAISALTQTTVVGLNEVVGVSCQWEMDDGFLSCFLPRDLSQDQWEQSQIVLETLFKGLAAIRTDYDEYLSIREVQSL